jgi:hypothetical protein
LFCHSQCDIFGMLCLICIVFHRVSVEVKVQFLLVL